MALSPAQVAQHWGAMLSFGLDRLALRDPPPDSFVLKNFIRLAIAYVNNGALGTQADRTQAMKAFVRRLFSSLTGRDPTIDAHFFVKHWLNGDDGQDGADTTLG